jgi:predicted CXXCH cytochrome family protein
VRLKFLFACAIVIFSCGPVLGQFTGDVIGVHDLGPGSKSPITGARPDFCLYCHAPHSSNVGGLSPMWNQTLSTQTYTPYTSSTYHETGNTKPPLGSDSSLCLSCHDGTVAPGTTGAYGKVTTRGVMNPGDILGTTALGSSQTDLSASHPFSLILPLNDAADLVATLASAKTTADTTGAVKLINGNIECTSCHNPHVQAKDPIAQNFLVKDSSSGALCLACHDPNRVMTGQTNPLNGWFQSIHAISSDQVSNLPYSTLAQNACFSCHTDHNGAGAEWLLRGVGDQVCLNCHSSVPSTSDPHSATASAVLMRGIAPTPTVVASPRLSASLNIAAEYGKIGHPLATKSDTVSTEIRAKNKTQAQSGFGSTAAQAGCVGCHSQHAAQTVTTVSPPPAVRASQKGVVGLSASDGLTLVNPAQNQFEICFVCHGPNSTRKGDILKYGYMPARLTAVVDPRNVFSQFNVNSTSSHPVVRARSSPLPQPSLLVNMLNLNGITQGRAVGVQIYCSDCHNSDDNREFGGTGANGPHGSKWLHILERRYEFSQAAAPGQPISNLYPQPDLSVNGPYALCGKCHNLSNIMQNASFRGHSIHVNQGFSCSVCHTAHGMGTSSTNLSGERLVNFDINVVAPNGTAAISYNRATNTCVLTCHGTAHNRDGTVTAASAGPQNHPLSIRR